MLSNKKIDEIKINEDIENLTKLYKEATKRFDDIYDNLRDDKTRELLEQKYGKLTFGYYQTKYREIIGVQRTLFFDKYNNFCDKIKKNEINLENELKKNKNIFSFEFPDQKSELEMIKQTLEKNNIDINDVDYNYYNIEIFLQKELQQKEIINNNDSFSIKQLINNTWNSITGVFKKISCKCPCTSKEAETEAIFQADNIIYE